MSVNYFEVIKTCFLLSLISIYCSLSLSLSLSIHFNFSWNFVSLWLWVVLDLSFFFFFFFHGILLVCGCGLLWIYLFIFWQISTFSSSSFVVKSMAKKNHEIFVIRFSFSLFFVCKFYWIFGFLGFFYLVLILGLF